MPRNHQNNEARFDEKARQAMRENEFEPDFPPDVIDWIEKLGPPPISNTDPGVRDMRKLLWSSIDNRTSRDLDQVEYVEKLDNGDIRLLIGIADVDSVVTKDSAIDRRAAKNTVTVYTESEVFPMLPEQISTDLTSMNEGRDRLAIVVELIIKENGDVPGNSVFRAIVHNHAKLSYDSVGEWIDENGPEPAKFAEVRNLKEQVLLQLEAAQRLNKYRKEKGALEFESVESSTVVVDGQIHDLKSERPNSARKIIENFMIAANVEMAEFLELNNSPSIRRVVKTPERWSRIRDLAKEYDADLPIEPNTRALSDFLVKRRAADPDHFPDLSLSIVKMIGSGEYVVKNPGVDSDGHFGLAVRDYAHSTAPNRRFPDLVVQRLVKAKLEGQPQPYSAEELENIARNCNERERSARKVERKMRKIVAATVMQRRVGESFDAIVTGAATKGTYARILRPPVDGRIVRGEERLDVGDKIRVRLLSANPRNGFIDFAAER